MKRSRVGASESSRRSGSRRGEGDARSGHSSSRSSRRDKDKDRDRERGRDGDRDQGRRDKERRCSPRDDRNRGHSRRHHADGRDSRRDRDGDAAEESESRHSRRHYDRGDRDHDNPLSVAARLLELAASQKDWRDVDYRVSHLGDVDYRPRSATPMSDVSGGGGHWKGYAAPLATRVDAYDGHAPRSEFSSPVDFTQVDFTQDPVREQYPEPEDPAPPPEGEYRLPDYSDPFDPCSTADPRVWRPHEVGAGGEHDEHPAWQHNWSAHRSYHSRALRFPHVYHDFDRPPDSPPRGARGPMEPYPYPYPFSHPPAPARCWDRYGWHLRRNEHPHPRAPEPRYRAHPASASYATFEVRPREHLPALQDDCVTSGSAARHEHTDENFNKVQHPHPDSSTCPCPLDDGDAEKAALRDPAGPPGPGPGRKSPLACVLLQRGDDSDKYTRHSLVFKPVGSAETGQPELEARVQPEHEPEPEPEDQSDDLRNVLDRKRSLTPPSEPRADFDLRATLARKHQLMISPSVRQRLSLDSSNFSVNSQSPTGRLFIAEDVHEQRSDADAEEMDPPEREVLDEVSIALQQCVDNYEYSNQHSLADSGNEEVEGETSLPHVSDLRCSLRARRGEGRHGGPVDGDVGDRGTRKRTRKRTSARTPQETPQLSPEKPCAPPSPPRHKVNLEFFRTRMRAKDFWNDLDSDTAMWDEEQEPYPCPQEQQFTHDCRDLEERSTDSQTDDAVDSDEPVAKKRSRHRHRKDPVFQNNEDLTTVSTEDGAGEYDAHYSSNLSADHYETDQDSNGPTLYQGTCRRYSVHEAYDNAYECLLNTGIITDEIQQYAEDLSLSRPEPDAESSEEGRSGAEAAAEAPVEENDAPEPATASAEAPVKENYAPEPATAAAEAHVKENDAPEPATEAHVKVNDAPELPELAPVSDEEDDAPKKKRRRRRQRRLRCGGDEDMQSVGSASTVSISVASTAGSEFEVASRVIAKAEDPAQVPAPSFETINPWYWVQEEYLTATPSDAENQPPESRGTGAAFFDVKPPLEADVIGGAGPAPAWYVEQEQEQVRQPTSVEGTEPGWDLTEEQERPPSAGPPPLEAVSEGTEEDNPCSDRPMRDADYQACLPSPARTPDSSFDSSPPSIDLMSPDGEGQGQGAGGGKEEEVCADLDEPPVLEPMQEAVQPVQPRQREQERERRSSSKPVSYAENSEESELERERQRQTGGESREQQVGISSHSDPVTIPKEKKRKPKSHKHQLKERPKSKSDTQHPKKHPKKRTKSRLPKKSTICRKHCPKTTLQSNFSKGSKKISTKAAVQSFAIESEAATNTAQVTATASTMLQSDFVNPLKVSKKLTAKPAVYPCTVESETVTNTAPLAAATSSASQSDFDNPLKVSKKASAKPAVHPCAVESETVSSDSPVASAVSAVSQSNFANITKGSKKTLTKSAVPSCTLQSAAASALLQSNFANIMKGTKKTSTKPTGQPCADESETAICTTTQAAATSAAMQSKFASILEGAQKTSVLPADQPCDVESKTVTSTVALAVVASKAPRKKATARKSIPSSSLLDKAHAASAGKVQTSGVTSDGQPVVMEPAADTPALDLNAPNEEGKKPLKSHGKGSKRGSASLRVKLPKKSMVGKHSKGHEKLGKEKSTKPKPASKKKL